MLIERLGEAHYHFLSLWPGAVQSHVYGATLAGNRLLPIPFRNHATWVRTRPDLVEPLIQAVERFFCELDAVPGFQLDPQTAPADFALSLIRAGFHKQVEEAWMVFAPAHAGQARTNAVVEVEQIEVGSAPETVQAYIDCYNVSFRSPPRAAAGFGESFRGVLPHPAGIHYLGRVKGEPAGCMSLFVEQGLGCVYNVGTFPSLRGQGVAQSLLLRLIDDARRLGVHTLFLQAVDHGPAQPLYQRVGFRTQFVRAWYLPQPPGGIWS